MFSKLALFTAVSMAVFATAIPTPGGEPSGNTIQNSCNAGAVQCCTHLFYLLFILCLPFLFLGNSIFDSTTPGLVGLLGLIGIVADVTGQVGLSCDPITVLGTSGTTW